MKIYQINLIDKGSTGKIACDLIEIKGDADTDRLFVGEKISNKKYVIQTQNKFGKTLHRFFYGVLSLDFGSERSTKKIIKIMQKNKPDIVHLHNLHGYYVNLKLLFNYLNENEIRVIWTLHDCWAFTGHCAHYDFVQCDLWQTECRHCRNLRQYPKSLFFDNSKREFYKKKKLYGNMKNLYLVTPSLWLANQVKKSFLKNHSCQVIYNGINLEVFHYTEPDFFKNLAKSEKKLLLGVASPFTKRKGIEDFVKFSEIIPEDYQIVLVGANKKQIKSFPDKILGITKTENQQQLAELYSIAYAFLNFTYEDNFPTVNLEALSCGTPVICYETGGATEMLSDKNSIVVKKGDYKSVLDKLPLVDALRKNREYFHPWVKENFSREVMLKQYQELYRTVLTEAKNI